MSGQFPWFSILLAPLTGGLAGALFTNICKSVQEHRQRPRLNVVFNDEDNGCKIKTVTTPAEYYWVRVKIINEGRSTARGVSVCVTTLTLDGHSTGRRQFLEEVFDLKVANYKDVFPFILAPNGGYRYLDVCHIKDGDAFFRYDLQAELERLRAREFGMKRGTYEADIFVSADNTEAVKKTIIWEWDGSFHGLNKFRVAAASKRFREP
jgi:hypothetical protein